MAKAMARERGRPAATGTGLLLAAALVAVVLAPGMSPAAEGDCVTAAVTAPVRLPDGSIQGPGELSVCVTLAYSPVAALHSARVDGHQVVMALSRRGEAAAASDRPEILFHRQPDGSLLLRGYVVPRGSRAVTYLLQPARRSPGAGGGEDAPAIAAASDVVLARWID